jgi:DNA-binding NtrC family response regulator
MSLCKECHKNKEYQEGYCGKCWKGVKADRKKTDGQINKIKAAIGDKKVKILCLDKEPAVLDSYKMILNIVGIEVVTAPDGESGLQMLTPEYDMVFTCINYGKNKMDGLEILKKIKEKYNYMPVAIITAYGLDPMHADVVLLGAFEYLRKPFLMKEIFELVEKGLALRRKEGSK